MSLDSKGFPNCFNSPQGKDSSLTKGLAASSLAKGNAGAASSTGDAQALEKPSFLRRRPGQNMVEKAEGATQEEKEALQDALGFGKMKKPASKAAKTTIFNTNALFISAPYQHNNLQHITINNTPSAQHHQHITINTPSSTQSHQHNLINASPSTQHHLHNTIYTTSSTHHQHNIINTTSSTHHHLHNTIYTTPSTQQHLHYIIKHWQVQHLEP